MTKGYNNKLDTHKRDSKHNQKLTTSNRILLQNLSSNRGYQDQQKDCQKHAQMSKEDKLDQQSSGELNFTKKIAK